MLLNGKNAVITGCLRGIGRTTMDIFAKNGANIWACSQAPDEEFENHINEIRINNNIDIIPLYFDLSDFDQVKEAMKKIISSKQNIDILVNIAGMTYNALFHMTTIDKMKLVFDIDYFSQILITQYITKIMVKQKKGSVINISSIAGLDGNPGQIAYSSAKAALIGATKTLAEELAEYNIRVNAIAPGLIKTDMTATIPQEKYERLLEKTKLKRVGLPEEIAETLLFLASDLSSYITGQTIRVDGGIG